MNIDRRIKELIDDVTMRMLNGKVTEDVPYTSLVSRYRVLKELDDFIAESRAAEAQGDEVPDDDP